jgi:AcrR family transcriptional regulator
VPSVTGGSITAHRRITSERIVDASSELLHEQGYDAITLADVARAAGMSRTTIHNSFPDKDPLVVAFSDHEASRYPVDLESTLAVIENPVDRLPTFIAEQLHHFATRGVLEQLLRDIPRDGAEDGHMVVDDIDDSGEVTETSLLRAHGVRPSANGRPRRRACSTA